MESTALGAHDFALTCRHYTRSATEDTALGLVVKTSAPTPQALGAAEAGGGGHISSLGGGGARWVADKTVDFGDDVAYLGEYQTASLEDVQIFRLPCPSCLAPDEQVLCVPAFASDGEGVSV